jgi:signal transduction histidine kinase
MRERTATLGGRIAVWSSTNEGTEIEIRIAAKTSYLSPGLRVRMLDVLTHYRRDREDSPKE